MAAERVMGVVIDVVKEAVLAALREDLVAHKEEVNELRLMLTAVEERNEATIAVMKAELEAVKQELAMVKGDSAEKLAESSRGSDERGRSRKRRQEMPAESAREEERRREEQELNWPRVLEDLAALKEWQRRRDLKMNVELEIRQSKGDQRATWQKIKSASGDFDLNLKHHHISDAMLGHVSTMTHLKSIDLGWSSGFSAEGIKHLYRLPRLEKLDLQKTDISDSTLEGIWSLTSLERLDLQRTKVTDDGLLHLAGLSSLKTLYLSYCEGVTSDGMVHVGRLSGLEQLWLNDTAVTNHGLQQLTALTKLTEFYPPEGGWLRNDAVRMRIGRKSGRQ